MVNTGTNLRVRPAHKTLLAVLGSAGGFKTQAGAAEVGIRMLSEALLAARLAKGRPDPGLEVLLAALNAAAQEAHPIQAGPWYRVTDDGRRLQRWSTERQAYVDVAPVLEIPQFPIRLL